MENTQPTIIKSKSPKPLPLVGCIPGLLLLIETIILIIDAQSLKNSLGVLRLGFIFIGIIPAIIIFPICFFKIKNEEDYIPPFVFALFWGLPAYFFTTVLCWTIVLEEYCEVTSRILRGYVYLPDIDICYVTGSPVLYLHLALLIAGMASLIFLLLFFIYRIRKIKKANPK